MENFSKKRSMSREQSVGKPKVMGKGALETTINAEPHLIGDKELLLTGRVQRRHIHRQPFLCEIAIQHYFPDRQE